MKSRTGQDCDRFMFFDIETIPDFSRVHLFGIPDAPGFIARENCPEPAHFILGPTGTKPKDKLEQELKQMISGADIPPPDWIGDCIDVEETLGKNRTTVVKLLKSTLCKIQAEIDGAEKALSACGLDPHRCRILSLGIAMGDGEIGISYADLSGDSGDTQKMNESESALLRDFWEAAENTTRFCGYNVHAFDLPVILARSAALGVQPTRSINMAKYTGDHLDMYLLMGQFGSGSGRLKDILRLHSIGREYDDGMHGGSVLDYWRRGQHSEIAEYNRVDVHNERELFKHFSGYFWE